ncbi:NADP-dependent malic enzyme [Denitratisoma oestradiolicum]|uniref:Putative fused malic enzyme oxidoreductase putative phosphotransacetylase n=1 Tax=Denitratisoma oestradiolicum TaxID=311182 RepID=A0A6S6YJQ6_9PROT|nr:NADP-dependent malic enzyme [Denitratisoma oestradiolicum]TWO79372.1 NADP-dependent malic enzyme [Denitratisoma oestradiolicum]CAB1367984.1 putative fused malic enzyme oxidoreductase; putative phosphotransacetylase [Denitratisoma oestradiolicum]
MDEQIRAAALEYHLKPKPGKISVTPIKPLATQGDLSLAYSPGVAAACDEIVADPANSYKYTSRGNLVAVITNGTAVLGLGNIGALAGKPVMEGKGVLFKKFAGVDVFDIEVNELDPDKLVDIIASLEPTFGGINLEDIKAPECFYIEKKLKERLKIPVFHDDQHGTAIIASAAVINGLRLVGKDISQVKLVCSGAGAAAIACLDLMVTLGLDPRNVYIADSKGVVYVGRDDKLDPSKARYAQKTEARTLVDVMPGADVFLGLSAAGVLKPEMIKDMAAHPIILAMANPVPEILPDVAKAVRPDVIIGTGRSDYPNQVNNVLCFPFIFRGALDVGATSITDEMKAACVRAIAELAHAEQSDIVSAAYGTEELKFGPEYLIPKPFDPRLIVKIAPAVAEAAMASGVATRPIADMDAYRQQLNEFVYHSGLVMKPVFASAKKNPARIVYCEGEDERVLRAVQTVVDEGLATPILIGRPDVVDMRIAKAGLRIRPGQHFGLVNPDSDSRYKELWQDYYEIMQRKGVGLEYAKREMRRRTTLIGSMLVKHGYADGLICGTFGKHSQHLRYIDSVIGQQPGVGSYYTLNMLIMPNRTLFIGDTYVNYDPTAEQLAEMTLLAAEEVRRFGIVPRVALLSHSSFGTEDTPTAVKMRRALEIVQQSAPQLEVEGEMHGDAALSETIRNQVFPNSRLKGPANLLIMPTLDAANIAFNLLKTVAGDGLTVGPMLLGTALPAHVLTPTATVRRIVNMSALISVEAAHKRG